MLIEGSSHLHSAEYDAESRILTVRFQNGAVGNYLHVPPEKWEGFQKAESKGKYLHAEIKPNHHYHKDIQTSQKGPD